MYLIISHLIYLTLMLLFIFRLGKFSNELKETVAYKVRVVELNTKYSQIAVENTNLKSTCEASKYIFDNNK